MKRPFWLAGIALVFAASLYTARQNSTGFKLRERAMEYTEALESGRGVDARAMMSPATAAGFSAEFLSGLTGIEAPENFVFHGTDSRGIRMAGETREYGTRIVWLVQGEETLVVHDTALDNILGNAVFFCRDNAMANPTGSCPVSGEPYLCDLSTGAVLCPQGHLGDGLLVSSNGCSLRRDSVAAEITACTGSGYPWPVSIEDIYLISSGEFGRRGGYRCPDNGYKYYEIRDGAVYCPFHEEATPIPAAE